MPFIRGTAFCAALVPMAGCGFVVVHGVRHAITAHRQQEDDVTAALARCAALVLRMQARPLVEMFDLNGELLRDGRDAIVGREALSAFIDSLVGFRVLEFELRATSTTLLGNEAVQQGNYHRKIVVPGGQSVTADGVFNARWLLQADGRWLIVRMQTTAKAGGGRGD